MVEISDLADGRHAIQTELANFTEGSLTSANVAFLTEQLRRAACARTTCAPLPGCNSGCAAAFRVG